MIASAVTTWTAKQVGGLVQSKCREAVIERWTRYRANCFFEAFCSELNAELLLGSENVEATKRLDDLLSDEVRSDVLFDAYRKVAFCASKELGPRIIGLLVGELFSTGRRATESEEKILQVAELMNDSELYSFLKLFREIELKVQQGKDDVRMIGSSIEMKWHQEVLDSNFSANQSVDIGGLDVELSFGGWALRLKQLGFVKDTVRVSRTSYREDAERHIDQDGELTTYWFVYTFQPECSELARLIVRAIPAAAAKASQAS